MFSRISVALAKSDAVTLKDLVKVIRDAYNPSSIVCTVENIYDVKSWLRPYVATLQHHSNPHAFRFKLNENSEVEMSYRPWVKSARKEWLPEEGPIVVLRQVPPGKPAVLKPDLRKCATVKDIRDNVEKLWVRMTTAQLEWWKEMADKEAKRRTSGSRSHQRTIAKLTNHLIYWILNSSPLTRIKKKKRNTGKEARSFCN